MKMTGQLEWLRTEDKGMHKIQSKIKSLLMQLGEEVEEGGWGGPANQTNEENQAGLRGAKSLHLHTKKHSLNPANNHFHW